jgi:hypothetical protein
MPEGLNERSPEPNADAAQNPRSDRRWRDHLSRRGEIAHRHAKPEPTRDPQARIVGARGGAATRKRHHQGGRQSSLAPRFQFSPVAGGWLRGFASQTKSNSKSPDGFESRTSGSRCRVPSSTLRHTGQASDPSGSGAWLSSPCTPWSAAQQSASIHPAASSEQCMVAGSHRATTTNQSNRVHQATTHN